MKLTDEQKRKMKGEVAKITPEDEAKVRDEFDSSVARYAAAGGKDAGFIENLRTMYRMLVDPDYVISWDTKAWILFGLAYFISPVDAIPDVIPVVGYLDDIAVVAWVMHHIQDEVVKYRKLKGLNQPPPGGGAAAAGTKRN